MPKIADYYQVIPSTAIKPVFLAGYKEHIKAGVALGRQAITNSWAYRVLVFGYPGTGKTDYPSVLAHALNANECKYSLLRIGCMGLASYLVEPRDVRNKLAEIERSILPQFKPLIIALDEFDAISPFRTRGSALDILCEWTMSFLGSSRENLSTTIIFCITNFPDRIDPAVLDRIEMNLHFGLPDKDMAVELLVHTGIRTEKAPEVVDELFGIAATQDVRFSGRSLLTGTRYALHLERELNDLPSKEIAAMIRIFSSPIKSIDVENYERENSARINLGKAFMQLWGARADDFGITV